MNSPVNEEYESFKTKRQAWIEWLSVKDCNSITQQIYRMIWDAAVYRIINEARRFAPQAKEGGVELNGMTHQLIDKCFFESQANAIRRLLDKAPAEGSKGVYSLYRLLDDMEQNVGLFTRENMFAAEGLEYNYQEVMRNADEYYQNQEQAGERELTVPEDIDWHRLVMKHEEIDKLANVDGNKRSPEDAVRPEYFTWFKSKLKIYDNILTYVNKFIAHASTTESRYEVKPNEISPTLRDLWQAHETICKIASFIRVYLLGEGSGPPLPVAQYDHFKFIDKPLIEYDKVQCLQDTWKEYEKETQSWSNCYLDELESKVFNSKRSPDKK